MSNIYLHSLKKNEDNQSNKSNKKHYVTETCHTIYRNKQKTVVEYSNHLLDDFRLMIVSPYPTLKIAKRRLL